MALLSTSKSRLLLAGTNIIKVRTAMAIKKIAIGGISTECSSYSPLHQNKDDFRPAFEVRSYWI